MTTFIVNGKEKELIYDVNGIDISGDFIGNTSHGMDQDDEGNYLAAQEDYDWWKNTINAHSATDALIKQYKEKFDHDDVDWIVGLWADSDLESCPALITQGLEGYFGKL